MGDYSEYIDAYFNQTLSQDEAEKFEQLLVSDKNFAEEVAFYVSAKQVLKEQLVEEKKEWFRELIRSENALTIEPDRKKVTRVWIYRSMAAAAILIVLISSWYLFSSKPLPVQQRAETYIQHDLNILPVTMSSKVDSLQQGLKLYNEAKLNASSQIFESIIKHDSSNYSAKKYLGIVYLRLAEYDKAFACFQQLEIYPLYSNPATFYQALTLMKRNQSGDKPKARLLLQKVVEHDLEGKQTAMQWLKKW